MEQSFCQMGKNETDISCYSFRIDTQMYANDFKKCNSNIGKEMVEREKHVQILVVNLNKVLVLEQVIFSTWKLLQKVLKPLSYLVAQTIFLRNGHFLILQKMWQSRIMVQFGKSIKHFQFHFLTFLVEKQLGKCFYRITLCPRRKNILFERGSEVVFWFYVSEKLKLFILWNWIYESKSVNSNIR